MMNSGGSRVRLKSSRTLSGHPAIVFISNASVSLPAEMFLG
jgi:hypothetical protein